MTKKLPVADLIVELQKVELGPSDVLVIRSEARFKDGELHRWLCVRLPQLSGCDQARIDLLALRELAVDLVDLRGQGNFHHHAPHSAAILRARRVALSGKAGKATNCAQTLLMAGPLSLRKSAMVL